MTMSAFPVVHLPWSEFKRIQETRNLPVCTENGTFAYLLTLIDTNVCWTAYIFKPTDSRYNAAIYRDWELHDKNLQMKVFTIETLTHLAHTVWPGTPLRITQKSPTRVIVRVKNQVHWDLTDPDPLWILHRILTALKFAH